MAGRQSPRVLKAELGSKWRGGQVTHLGTVRQGEERYREAKPEAG